MGHALEADRLLIRRTGGPGPVPATTTDRSDEGHAEAAGSVESHIGSPTPSLVVLHPGAPQRHSQIRRSRPSVRTGPADWPSRPEPQSALRARPKLYEVSCTVWLPEWLPVWDLDHLIRRRVRLVPRAVREPLESAPSRVDPSNVCWWLCADCLSKVLAPPDVLRSQQSVSPAQGLGLD